MVKFISHRGNRIGPFPEKENSPDYVQSALDAGYDVEVDLRVVDDMLFLGHDYPQYPVTPRWIQQRRHKLLLHLKDAKTLLWVSNGLHTWHYFCHTSDPFTFTNHRHVWLHDLSIAATSECIVPLISKELLNSYKDRSMYAICSDFVP